jgi:hypothetical protein
MRGKARQMRTAIPLGFLREPARWDDRLAGEKFGASVMARKSRRGGTNSPPRAAKADRAAVAARDPAPGSRNRPGFDLGGAVGDAKPERRNPMGRSTAQAKRKTKTARAKKRPAR